MILALLLFTIFVSYVLFVYFKYGVLTSISTSWYRLPPKQKILFYFFCISIGILLLFQDNLFFFLSGAGIIFTGTAAAYEEKMTNIVHFSGAVICIVMALLGLSIDHQIYFPLLSIPISLVIFLAKTKNFLWWIEIVCFLFIISGMLFI